jgi:hypothetical protein
MRYLLIFILFIIGLVIIPKIAGNFSQPIAGIVLFSLFAILLFLLNKTKINKEPEVRTAPAPTIEKFSTCTDCAKTFYDSDCPNKLCPDCGKPLQS